MRTRFYQNLFEKYGFMRTYAKKIQIFLQFLYVHLLYTALWKNMQTLLRVFIYFSKMLLLVEFCLLTQRLPRLLCLNMSSIKKICKHTMQTKCFQVSKIF